MIPFQAVILCLLVLAPPQPESWVRVPVTFQTTPLYHPLFRVADGTVSIRFKAKAIHGRFTEIESMETGEQRTGMAKWFIPQIIEKASVKQEQNQAQIFEMRMCNCACGPTHPLGYSFWQLK